METMSAEEFQARENARAIEFKAAVATALETEAEELKRRVAALEDGLQAVLTLVQIVRQQMQALVEGKDFTWPTSR